MSLRATRGNTPRPARYLEAMRQRAPRTGWLLLAGALGVGCASEPSSGVERDAFPPREAGALDAADARADAADAWRPLGPPIGAQSWDQPLRVRAIDAILTVTTAPRVDPAPITAIVGGPGRATTVVFDETSEGWFLARSAIPFVVPNPARGPCAELDIALSGVGLHYTDADGDGARERLSSITIAAASGTDDTGMATDVYLSAAASPVEDTSTPELHVLPEVAIAGADVLTLVASEPIDASFAPRLVGPRTYALVPDPGSSSAARWSLATTGLAPGSYTLVADATPSDLAGHVGPLPAPTLEVAEPLRCDGIDAEIRGVVASPPPTLLVTGPGSPTLEGSSSIVAPARSAVLFDRPPGAASFQGVFAVRTPHGAADGEVVVSLRPLGASTSVVWSTFSGRAPFSLSTPLPARTPSGPEGVFVEAYFRSDGPPCEGSASATIEVLLDSLELF